MGTYVITQGIQGPEGAQGATGPAGSGGGGGSNEVYFAGYLANEADFGVELAGTFNSGVSISDLGEPMPVGTRIVVIPTGGGLYQSFVSDGTTTLPYEVPQLSTFAKQPGDLTGQSALLNAYYDISSGEVTPNTIYLMFGDQLIPQSSGGGGLHASNVNVGAFTGILNTATPPSNVQEALDIVDGLDPVQSDGTILDIVKLTQAAYDLLTPVSTTLYVIVG